MADELYHNGRMKVDLPAMAVEGTKTVPEKEEAEEEEEDD